MNKKKRNLIFIILIIILFLIFLFWKVFHPERKETEQDNTFVYVDGNLSINFIDGNHINFKEKENSYQFSITNTSESENYYNINLDSVYGGVGAEFELQSSREGFKTITQEYPTSSLEILEKIKITSNETHTYLIYIKNPKEKIVEGTIKIAKEQDMNTFANIILKDNSVNKEPKTLIAQNIATENEGLIENTDEDGTSYYFRGDIPNNYVSFANKIWRIVKINGDGSVKLILNELINNNTPFYNKENSFDLNFENSQIYQELEDWYQVNLTNYDSIIANNRFCTDTSYDDKGFSSLTRIYTDYNPNFHCLGTLSTSKIGLLTADEAAFAGATNKEPNNKYYLYNPDIKTTWWTMNPAKNLNENYYYIEMQQNGTLNEGSLGTLFRGSRPVINIEKRATASGTGTTDDPYIVNSL